MKLKTPPSQSSLVALCSAVAFADGDGAPEWINLLPAGPVRTIDGRGPYTVASMAALIAASLPEGGKLVLDENHATDKGMALGLPAPAQGWIVALEAREDGLWGKVDWTGPGRQLMADKAYSGVSPVIAHTKDGRIMRLLRVSLTNTPNLQGLVSLHSEGSTMDWKAKLIELLGLDSSADDAAIDAALTAKMTAMAMQSQGDVLNLIEHPTVIALQSELTSATAQIKALTDGQARKDATAFVDGAIREGRAGLKPMRDEYIALHMENPTRAEKLIGSMVKLTGSTITDSVIDDKGERGLAAEDRQVMALFGVSEEDYQAELKSAGLQKEAL